MNDKPEVFYFGHVIGATGVTEGDGIFLEMYEDLYQVIRYIKHKLLMLM